MSEDSGRKRYLPLFDQGEWITYPALALWCCMNYGDDMLSAKRATILLSDENLDMVAGLQRGYSHLAKLVMDEVARNLLRRRMCGYIALEVAKNIDHRGKPEVGRAVHAVACWGEQTKTTEGKPLPSDPRGLRKYFRQYRDVIHLWAAYELLSDDQHTQLSTLNQDTLEELLVTAMKFEEFFDQTNAFPSWNPWRIPPEFRATHPPSAYRLGMPTESDWLRRILSEYSPDLIR